MNPYKFGLDTTSGKDELKAFRKKMRTLIADYMSSEGCSCCQNIKAHQEHLERIAKILGVKKYPDGSGYNFSVHRSKKN